MPTASALRTSRNKHTQEKLASPFHPKQKIKKNNVCLSEISSSTPWCKRTQLQFKSFKFHQTSPACSGSEIDFDDPSSNTGRDHDAPFCINTLLKQSRAQIPVGFIMHTLPQIPHWNRAQFKFRSGLLCTFCPNTVWKESRVQISVGFITHTLAQIPHWNRAEFKFRSGLLCTFCPNTQWKESRVQTPVGFIMHTFAKISYGNVRIYHFSLHRHSNGFIAEYTWLSRRVWQLV